MENKHYLAETALKTKQLKSQNLGIKALVLEQVKTLLEAERLRKSRLHQWSNLVYISRITRTLFKQFVEDKDDYYIANRRYMLARNIQRQFRKLLDHQSRGRHCQAVLGPRQQIKVLHYKKITSTFNFLSTVFGAAQFDAGTKLMVARFVEAQVPTDRMKSAIRGHLDAVYTIQRKFNALISNRRQKIKTLTHYWCQIV